MRPDWGWKERRQTLNALRLPRLLVGSVLGRLLVKSWVPRPKAHGLTAPWVLAHCKRSSLHKKIYFKLPIKPVFRRKQVSKDWQALSPVFSKGLAQQRLGRVKPLPMLRQVRQAQPKAQPLEHKRLLMLPDQMFKALKQGLLPRALGA